MLHITHLHRLLAHRSNAWLPVGPTPHCAKFQHVPLKKSRARCLSTINKRHLRSFPLRSLLIEGCCLQIFLVVVVIMT